MISTCNSKDTPQGQYFFAMPLSRRTQYPEAMWEFCIFCVLNHLALLTAIRQVVFEFFKDVPLQHFSIILCVITAEFDRPVAFA